MRAKFDYKVQTKNNYDMNDFFLCVSFDLFNSDFN